MSDVDLRLDEARQLIDEARQHLASLPVADPDHWTSVVDWWQHPALAYLAGLQDGARLERDRADADRDAWCRQAARDAVATTSMLAARGELATQLTAAIMRKGSPDA